MAASRKIQNKHQIKNQCYLRVFATLYNFVHLCWSNIILFFLCLIKLQILYKLITSMTNTYKIT